MFALCLGACVLPHGVHVRRGQARTADRRAVVRPHYPLCQQEIAEQAGHQQVLTKQLLEQIWRRGEREQTRAVTSEAGGKRVGWGRGVEARKTRGRACERKSEGVKVEQNGFFGGKAVVCCVCCQNTEDGDAD